MATATKRLCKGTLGAVNGTLYTAPSTAGSYAVIKAITLCNKTANTATVTLKFAGTEVIYQHSILARDTITIPFIDQIIETSELIEGLSDTSSAINYYVSGKEVTS